jgi:hypothetical protein
VPFEGVFQGFLAEIDCFMSPYRSFYYLLSKRKNNKASIEKKKKKKKQRQAKAVPGAADGWEEERTGLQWCLCVPVLCAVLFV